MKRSIFFFAAIFMVASGAFAGGPGLDRVEVDPPNPTTLDFIEASVMLYSSEATYLVGSTIEERTITLEFADLCAIICPPGLFEHHVPLGYLAEGDWQISLRWENGQVLDVLDVRVAAPPDRVRLKLDPASPTEADRIALQVLYRTQPCQARPTLGPVERIGNTFALEMALGDIELDCAGDEPKRGSLPVDLGPLAAGFYRVELDLRSAGGGETNLLPLEFTVAATTGAELLGRFRASLTWRTLDGVEGDAKPVPGGSEESALFSFFNAENWEVMVKVLDGCAINGNYWVFLAAATDVEFTLTVDDLAGTRPPYTYRSPPGLFTLPLGDTAAFPCAP